MKRRLPYVLSVLLNICLVAAVLFYLWTQWAHSQLPLLSPRIFVQKPNDIIINFTPLRSELRSFVGSQKNFRTGVYFEYLPTGVSIGVNEKEEFISASLLKVPFVIGVFERLETGALHMQDVLTLQEKDMDPKFGTLWKRGAGTQLTVEEAIRLAITQSDNTAARALDSLMSHDLVREVYDALDIPIVLDMNNPVVSPKNYSSVFRCLYLSCFLRHESSEMILELLTQTIFSDGIQAGVPSDVNVAHKVGFYDSFDSTKKVRSDCGIIFLPKRPYILCAVIELEGGHEQEATDFFRELSSRVYRFVSGVSDSH